MVEEWVFDIGLQLFNITHLLSLPLITQPASLQTWDSGDRHLSQPPNLHPCHRNTIN
jgi:hypothetical protein